jgi:lactoylglutathione lyase
MSKPAPTHFGFTKLIVQDLEKSAAFYTTVCGLKELARVDADVNGRPISEIMYNPTGEGGATFVLFKFTGEHRAGSDEVILGFQTENLVEFLARVEAAGGALAQPIREMPEHGIRVAFVKDVEGHLIEVVELLAPSGAHAH